MRKGEPTRSLQQIERGVAAAVLPTRRSKGVPDRPREAGSGFATAAAEGQFLTGREAGDRAGRRLTVLYCEGAGSTHGHIGRLDAFIRGGIGAAEIACVGAFSRADELLHAAA